MAKPHTIAVAGKGGVGKTTTCGMMIDYLCFLPRMQENAWNLISFHTGSGLSVEPAPDTGIQVCMIFKALSAPVEIGQQTLTAADRSGFTVVQWCGGEVK